MQRLWQSSKLPLQSCDPDQGSRSCSAAFRRRASRPVSSLESRHPAVGVSGKSVHCPCRGATQSQRGRRKAAQAPQASAQYGQMEGSPNRRPPGILIRVLSAFFFMIPWMDVFLLGREMYHRFPHTLIFYYLGKPLMPYYFLSQWTPLVLFFLMYLYVIRNTKLHHFMRFNCMQAIMLDIITMVFNLLRSYFPAEFRWSILMDFYDMFAFNACMCTIVYCMFYALRGRYADIPYVSESVYLQVEPSV